MWWSSCIFWLRLRTRIYGIFVWTRFVWLFRNVYILNCLEIDECWSTPCQYWGTCDDFINYYTCKCVPGITGSNCEISLFTVSIFLKELFRFGRMWIKSVYFSRCKCNMQRHGEWIQLYVYGYMDGYPVWYGCVAVLNYNNLYSS